MLLLQGQLKAKTKRIENCREQGRRYVVVLRGRRSLSSPLVALNLCQEYTGRNASLPDLIVVVVVAKWWNMERDMKENIPFRTTENIQSKQELLRRRRKTSSGGGDGGLCGELPPYIASKCPFGSSSRDDAPPRRRTVFFSTTQSTSIIPT